MQHYTRTGLVATFALALMIAGCNVFDGFYEEGTSNDVEVLIVDAQSAFQTGNFKKAVDILEKAHKADPGHPQVRVDLSNALLRSRNVGVLDIVLVAENISGKGASEGFGKAGGAFCSFDQSHTIVGTFDYTNVDGYSKLLENRDVFDRVSELITPLLPAAINSIQVGEDYDRKELLRAIKNTGVAESRIDALLMSYAASVIIDTYLAIFQNDDYPIEWYNVRGEGGNEYIGYCVASFDDQEELQQSAACSMRRLGMAVIAIDLRAQHLGNAKAAREVADEARDAYESLKIELENNDISCG